MTGRGAIAFLLTLWCAPIDSDTRPPRAVWVLDGHVVAELHELSEGALDKSGPGGGLLFADGGERLDCPELSLVRSFLRALSDQLRRAERI